jgi:hypothetical protein
MTSGKEQIYNFLDEPEPPAPGRPNGIGMAKLLLENCWHLPRSPKVCFAPPLTFTEDPFGEKYWRILFYSLRPLANLSFAWGATEDPRYGDKLVELLTWFVEARSTANGSYLWDRHTAAFRAMMLVNLHRKLEAHGALTPTLERELPLAIAETAAFLALPSSFEAGNNHGYTEAAALLLVAELYPEHDQAAAWRTLAQERLLTVTQNTVGSDGVLIEQSTFYHFYSLALLFQITDWARRFGVALAPEVTSAVQKMIRFATLVPQPDGMVPRLDASNALDLGAFNVSVLDALAQQHPEFAFVRSQGRAGARPADADLAALFPESGKAVLRSSFGSTASFTAQAHVVFDAGPYRTAHSQLDALNVHLFGGGRELLTDSGLFSLESDLEEFDYYSGTAAHNTVVVDGADQKRGAAYAGPTVLEGDARWQSGWHTLYPGVLHTRGVLLLGRGSLTVIDRMNSGEQHRYAQMWHLSPDLEVALSNSGGVITDSRGAVVARFTTTSAGTTHLQRVRGRANPRQGWYATMYETEVPGTVVEIEEEGSSSSLRITSFSFGPDARHTPELEVAEREDELSATLTLGTKRRVLTVQSFGTTREVFSLLEE